MVLDLDVVPEVGLEPTRRISPADFESAASTNFATPARVRPGGGRESGRHYNSESGSVNSRNIGGRIRSDAEF